MRVLQLYYKLPFPLNDGGAYSIYHSSLSLLRQKVDLKILAMDLLKGREKTTRWPENFISDTKFESVVVDNRIKPVKAFLNLFSNTSYFSDRFNSPVYHTRLIEILKTQEFEIVQLEHLYLCHYLDVIRQFSKAKIILRMQNVENELWFGYIKKLNNPFLKFFLSVATKRLALFENRAITQVDGILALSDEDAAYFKNHSPRVKIKTVPIGLELSSFSQKETEPIGRKTSLTLYHLGSMDWKPNSTGLKWFMKHVWPILKRELPALKFVIAGKHMPSWFFKQAGENLEVKSWIEDSLAFQEDKQVLIVPLLVGSGIRVKILEAMALGKTVISTTIGAKGIACKDGENILIADHAEEFLRHLKTCLASKDFCNRLGKNAQQLVREKYEVKKIGDEMISFYKTL